MLRKIYLKKIYKEETVTKERDAFKTIYFGSQNVLLIYIRFTQCFCYFKRRVNEDKRQINGK